MIRMTFSTVRAPGPGLDRRVVGHRATMPSMLAVPVIAPSGGQPVR
jgi:hypothetical protein